MSEPTAASRERPRGSASTLAIIPAVALGIFGADQAAKAWALSALPEGRTVPVVGEVLQWHLVRNPGAAFSLASGQTWIFTIIAVAVAIGIAVFARRIRSRMWATLLGLVLGGTLGNLADRLFREPGFGVGHVVDFISTPWMMPAIYNVADSAIVVAMCALVLLTLLDHRMDGSTRRSRADAERDAGSAAAAAAAAEPEPTEPAGAGAARPTGADAADLDPSADPAARDAEASR